MDSDEAVRAEYRRIYSAAARMYWLQQGEVGAHPAWSQERKDSWLALGRILREHAAPAVELAGLSDPTRHLIGRRTPDDRPVSLGRAAHDWQERLDTSPPVRYPRLDPDPDSTGEDAYSFEPFAPDSCVLVPSAWLSSAASSVGELSRRLAPGRPAHTIGPEAAHLSQTFHALAEQIRHAFPGTEPRPHPAKADWIAGAPTPHIGSTDPADLDELRAAAHDAPHSTPTKEQAVAAKDASSSIEVIEAGEVLRGVLAGSEEEPWRERQEGVDPARSLLVSGEHTFESWDARLRTKALEREPLPRVPTEAENPVRPTESLRMKAIARESALVLAEVLDENAARLHPGRRTEMVGFDAYPLSRFLGAFTTHLLSL